MSIPVGKLAIYPDLLALGEDVRAEILAGQIVTSPAPLPRHSKTQGALRRFVGGPFDDDDGGAGREGGGFSWRSTFSSECMTSCVPILPAGAAQDCLDLEMHVR